MTRTLMDWLRVRAISKASSRPLLVRYSVNTGINEMVRDQVKDIGIDITVTPLDKATRNQKVYLDWEFHRGNLSEIGNEYFGG